ncbi:hypothetical protein M2163_004470 [Streptomyces sp. SAI-135]|uniref:hypothetical protein n=1 Tax=unclassified Streptomyces TaxID=2593676 RepID=UPI002474A2FA|nr:MULTISPECIES: hypothetical protein [unclassified Streptomyces]MDH6518545.1 hypothetical protein [Streptomyces sp. SAI-090]MDH6617362.1 hypothetical protein [Streptomyces sp. SAI-135]
MYGHGAVPPARSSGTVITLRVLLAAAGFLSCGLLACAPLFRVAFLRGRSVDWVLAWASLPLSIACFAVVGALPESDPRTDVAMALVLLFGLFSSVYFLVMDIRVHQQRQFAGYPPPQGPTVHTGYGYPHPAPSPTPPYASTLQPPQPQPSAPPVPGPGVVPPPPPQRPAPARIDQVRAELDELSDYLRKHDGNSEGGR